MMMMMTKTMNNTISPASQSDWVNLSIG